jgi:hypothetical protein
MIANNIPQGKSQLIIKIKNFLKAKMSIYAKIS